MKITVIIPTFDRPEYLAKSLSGLERQLRPVDEVIVGVRAGDASTARFLASYREYSKLPITLTTVHVPGVVANMAAAVAESSGDVICLLDDDAEPFDDWLQKIEARFTADERLGALGGRDLLQDHPEMRKTESTTERVGVFTWYGRILGNHHRGSGSYRRVSVLKGCNSAFRGPLLREIGFETRLRGAGAQVHWELALCFDVAAKRYDVAYDPAIRVIHHIAPRKDVDQIHRGGFSPDALFDMVFNEHFVVNSRVASKKRIAHLLWSVLVGSTVAPGFIQYVRLLLRGEKHFKARLSATRRGIRAARRLIKGRP